MDIDKLLNRRCARKDARKAKKQLTKVIRSAASRKLKPDEAVKQYFDAKNKKGKKNRQHKRGIRSKATRAERRAKRVDAELVEHQEEEAVYKKEVQGERKKIIGDSSADDAEIKKYEKLLGYDKRKSKSVPKAIAVDGFADLWEFCDTEQRKSLIENDDENDLGIGQITPDEDPDREEINLSENDSVNSSDDENDAVEDMEVDFDDDKLLAGDDDGDELFSDAEDFDEVSEASGQSDPEENIESDDEEVKEDIYGRQIDAKTGKVLIAGTAAGAKRKLEELNQNSAELAESRAKIAKMLRGALNRLNERTLVASVKALGDLFRQSSHNDVKEIFYDTFLKATQTVYALPDRLLLDYAMFIALTHVTVSSEISSHFVESFALYLIDELEKAEDKDEKALENATALLCHLFNFRVLKPQFIIDLMVKFRNYARAKPVGLLIHALTYAGGMLKKKYNTPLTTFISETQNFFLKLEDEKKEGFRMKYLIEDLMAAKAGNIGSITSKFDDSLLDNCGKLYKSLIKGHDDKKTELPFLVDDILHVADRGRWWVVGSAWTPGAAPGDVPDAEAIAKATAKKDKKALRFDDNLLTLAKKAKMNTETRRNIFCSIVSSDDDMEAFERLVKLGLKDSQEREIIHIAVVCTLMEANYNPFYATVIERFCDFHKRFIITTQFAIWDRIKELNNLKKFQRVNLSFLTADLIRIGAVGLSVLKIVDFATIVPTTTAFLRRTFYRLLSKATDSFLTLTFGKAIKNESLQLFVQGLRLFFEISMTEESVGEVPDAKLVLQRLRLVKDLLLTVD